MMIVTAPKRTQQQRLKMSYEAYLDFANDNQLVEWVDGEVLIQMPASDKHQDISRFLTVLLDLFVQFFNLGAVRHAPMEVKLWPEGPAREPDLLFVQTQRLERLTDKRFIGGPDLVIEIISPSSITQDRVYKFEEYQQAGVGEYWIIDPRWRQQHVDFYVLAEDGLFYPAAVAKNGRYTATVLPHFWFDLDWLWQEPLPNPQLAFAEIMLTLDTLPSASKAIFQSLYDLLANKT